MRRLLPVLLVLMLLAGCAAPAASPAADTLPAEADRPAEATAPIVTEEPDVAPPADAADTPEQDTQSTPDQPAAPNEGDVDDATLAEIDALEQDSVVRNDDVAPVEASAYCRFSVTCAALVERQLELPDLLLPPDGVFYSGAIVLHGGETAMSLAESTLASCGLICQLNDDGSIAQIAAIPNDLLDDMSWQLYCNGTVLDDPANASIASGDQLELRYDMK